MGKLPLLFEVFGESPSPCVVTVAAVVADTPQWCLHCMVAAQSPPTGSMQQSPSKVEASCQQFTISATDGLLRYIYGVCVIPCSVLLHTPLPLPPSPSLLLCVCGVVQMPVL